MQRRGARGSETPQLTPDLFQRAAAQPHSRKGKHVLGSQKTLETSAPGKAELEVAAEPPAAEPASLWIPESPGSSEAAAAPRESAPAPSPPLPRSLPRRPGLPGTPSGWRRLKPAPAPPFLGLGHLRKGTSPGPAWDSVPDRPLSPSSRPRGDREAAGGDLYKST